MVLKQVVFILHLSAKWDLNYPEAIYSLYVSYLVRISIRLSIEILTYLITGAAPDLVSFTLYMSQASYALYGT